jgi:predicted enzyme related to lactoylglutathione lyase
MTRKNVPAWPTWIGVVVDDLGRQRQFWGDVLGLPEVAAGPDYVQFDMGRGRVFELIKRSDLPQYDRRRFQVGFAIEDIERGRGQLIQQGAEPLTEIMGGDTSSWAYFRDPEGNVFEITQRPGFGSDEL